MILNSVWSNNFDNSIAIAFSKFFDILPSKFKEAIVVFSALGNLGIFLLISGVLLILLKKTRKIGLVCLLSVLFTLIFNDLIFKNIFDRARPFEDPNLINNLVSIVNNNNTVYGLKPDSPSFPSGHTFQFFATFSALLFFYIKRKEERTFYLPYVIFFGIFGILMGFSRVLLSHHYFSDVIVGAIIGFIIGISSFYIIEYSPTLLSKIKVKLLKEKNK